MLLIAKVVLILFCALTHFVLSDTDDGFSIGLSRQKSALERHLASSKRLMEDGFDVSWLYKKPHNRTNDSVAIYRYLDNEFYAKITIGHPPQSVNLALDTSWSASWVISSDCSWTNIGCYYHNKYDHRTSQTYDKVGTPFSINEGSYNLTGYNSMDTFFIAHSNVTKQVFGEVVSVPAGYLFSNTDGALGFGLQRDSTLPFVYNLFQQGTFKNRLFSVYLNRDKQSDHGGNVIIGFIDSKHVHNVPDGHGGKIYNNITYLPVKPGGYWEFDLDAVYFNGTQTRPPLKMCVTRCTAISDTSSTSIYGPEDQVKEIHDLIGATPFVMGRYWLACDTVNKLPGMAFTIAGKNFTLHPRDYTVKMSYKGIGVCLTTFVPYPSKTMWVLGGSFLSQYYSIYDLENKQFGLVEVA